MRVDVADAVKDAAGGVALDVEVVPGARESEFPAGWNAWRRRVEARVAAPPVDGAANAELARIVAAFLDVPAARVTVTSGLASRRKTLIVEGVDRSAVAARLSEALG